MTTEQTSQEYDASSIHVYQGLDGIRKRPSMYIGELGDHAVYHLLLEAITNTIDEYYAGRNKLIQIYAGAKVFAVHDASDGIPVEDIVIKVDGRSSKISALTAIFTMIHAGGKFGNHAYKVSGGTHGVGVKTITALSTELRVWTFRNHKWYHQRFSRGEILSDVVNEQPPDNIRGMFSVDIKKGTVLAWKPDFTILGAEARLNVDNLLKYCSDVSHMNAGLRILVRNSGTDTEFLNKRGPIEYIEEAMVRLSVESEGKPIILDTDSIKVACQLSSYDDQDGFTGYVNSIITPSGGEHVVGFWQALQNALKPHQLQKHTFRPADLRYGIVGFINFMMSEPYFSGQTKEQLASPVRPQVVQELTPALTEFFARNKATAKLLLDRATNINVARSKAKEMVAAVSDMRQKSGVRRGLLLPSILEQATSAKPEQRELFIVEGDSAAGTAKYARYREYQEILKLKGKPINAARCPLARTLSCEPVQHILTAIGYDPVKKVLNPRVGRVFVLADPDPDGHHITLLVLTILWTICPQLITENKVFIVDTPLFMAKAKGHTYFAYSLNEIKSVIPEGTSAPITRIKGYGEINPDDLRTIAFDPRTRKTIRIQPVSDSDKLRLSKVVGEDSGLRKELLGIVDNRGLA